jgi:hypothetical protein
MVQSTHYFWSEIVLLLSHFGELVTKDLQKLRC